MEVFHLNKTQISSFPYTFAYS